MPLPLPFRIKVGSFVIPDVDKPATITGVGFKPKAIVFFACGNSNADAWEGAGTDAQTQGMLIGVASSAPEAGVETSDEGGCVAEAAGDGITSVGFPEAHVHNSLGRWAIRWYDKDGTLMGMGVVSSWDADGFTIDFQFMFGYLTIVNYIAFGGEELVAKVAKWRAPTAYPGTQDIAVDELGFRPDLVFHFFGSSNFDPAPWLEFTDGAQSTWRIGACDAALNQWCASFASNGLFPTDEKRSLSTTRAMYGTEYGGYPDVEARQISMDADGFTMRVFNSTRPHAVISLCLGNVKAKVGTITKPTTTQSQATTGIGFQPQGLVLCGIAAAVGPADGIRLGLGAASSSTSRRAVARQGADNVNTTDEKKWTDLDKVFYGPNSAEVTHADLTSFDVDGWTLAWTTSFAGSYPVAYVAIGAPDVPLHQIEAELNGFGNGWTNITRDVLLESPVSISYGIGGTGPVDLVASTGTMKFALDNSENNSAGVVGYYSPRHPKVRPGFQLGIRVRYTYVIPPAGTDGYGKFIGRLRDIEPEPGRYRTRRTVCQAVDWMNEAAITRYNAPTQVNKRADEVLTTIVALVPRQPDGTTFDVANSTFPYALDNGPVEKSSVMTEIQRICQSEYGRCYIKGGLNVWGRLRFEKRTARLTPSPVAVFDGTMKTLNAASGSGKVKNKAKVAAHPRRVDSVTTTVLFAKPNQNNPSVVPAATLRMSGRYTDPANPNARVGGTDMVAPVATTDYLMNAAANGSGANLTANFTVVATYGANQVDYAITNNGGTTGFVTKLQARGRGLYDYDPLEAEEENQTSIDAIGESVVTLDMPYQGDFETAKAIAKFLVDTWSSHEGTSTNDARGSSPGITEISIKLIPRTDAELTALMALEPGDAVSVTEWLSVVNDVYFIQGLGFRIDGDSVSFDFDLQRALVQSFWTLGTAGKSELGITTVLAPL